MAWGPCSLRRAGFSGARLLREQMVKSGSDFRLWFEELRQRVTDELIWKDRCQVWLCLRLETHASCHDPRGAVSSYSM